LLILSILVGFVAWSLPGIGLLVILFDLGFVVSPERAIGIFSLSLLAGVFSIFSGGLGTTEAALGLLLLTVGVDPPLAVAAAIISRVSTLWFAVALGSLMLIWSVSLVGARGEITQARHKA
jgi:uncharacterized protein (TIRG00374 family)